MKMNLSVFWYQNLLRISDLPNRLRSFVLERIYLFTFLSILCLVCVSIYARILYVKAERERFLKDFPDEYNASYDYYLDLKFKEAAWKMNTIEDIKAQIRRVNDKQFIYNGGLRTIRKGTPVIVVQVHRRLAYFYEMLESLRRVLGITRALVIFSHDYFDEDINSLIRNITFTKVMQIFYPYSVQLHPKIFPGNDPSFCDKSWACVQSTNRRNATLSQIKHHWWWKANQVFDHLRVTENYNGMVIFLEEDLYLTEDFIYMFKLLEKLLPTKCPQCEIISLGSRFPLQSQFPAGKGYAEIKSWGSTAFNMGMAFNRTIWNIIKKLSHHFCYYNDYNWDYSLRYLATKRPAGHFFMLASEGPRVFHIGKCGIHKTSEDCDIMEKLEVIELFLQKANKGLFPRHVVVRQFDGIVKVNRQEHGNWDDVRDCELCTSFVGKSRVNV